MHEYQGRRWEVEIWFQKTLSKDGDNFDKLLSMATNEQKKAILELKALRDAGNIPKDQLNSARIYKRVLVEGKINIDDFLSS